MGRYTTIPQNAFDALQLDAGVLLKHFDIESATSSVDNPGFTDEDLICATTGGVNPSCTAEYSDLGEDVDNVPVNMKELKHLDSWNCVLSTTSLGTSPELIKMSLGCADISEDGKSIIPRASLKQSDFSDIWWVGDKANGGFVAIRILNALSTGGFSLQTTKNGKGQTDLEITGHVSINAQQTVPMIFYSIDPDEGTIYTVSFDTNGGSTVEDQTIESGGKVTRPEDPTKSGQIFDGWYADAAFVTAWDFDSNTILADTTIYAKWVAVGISITPKTASIAVGGTVELTAVTVPEDETVTWTSSDDDVATVADGTVTGISSGEVTITATITVDDMEYTDTSTITVTA